MSSKVKPQRESLEIVVLSVLNEEPLYGYAIIKRVASRSDDAIRLTAGVLYPLLHELEAARLIESTWETVRSDRAGESSAGRKRKWYQITARGRRRLSQRASALRAFQSMIEAFLPPHVAADEEAAT
ncbi:MAG: helix-turn-helix transcriptional regulator [Phycisphaerales bacterium]|nr:helix-turn-helix transcriptional regulator [Phycisphaerales bacterium]